MLWENRQEQHAEEEYDTDGDLVYQSPPLDEVWLYEPERQEQKDRLRHQHGRQIQRER